MSEAERDYRMDTVRAVRVATRRLDSLTDAQVVELWIKWSRLAGNKWTVCESNTVDNFVDWLRRLRTTRTRS